MTQSKTSEIGQLKNNRQLKRSVGNTRPMVALMISSLNEPLKSNFPNKKVLITEDSFCAKIFGSMKLILFQRDLHNR